jgi:hypothetical protein
MKIELSIDELSTIHLCMLGAKSNLIENLDNPELRDIVIKNLNKINPLMYQITEYLKESKKA